MMSVEVIANYITSASHYQILTEEEERWDARL